MVTPPSLHKTGQSSASGTRHGSREEGSVPATESRGGDGTKPVVLTCLDSVVIISVLSFSGKVQRLLDGWQVSKHWLPCGYMWESCRGPSRGRRSSQRSVLWWGRDLTPWLTSSKPAASPKLPFAVPHRPHCTITVSQPGSLWVILSPCSCARPVTYSWRISLCVPSLLLKLLPGSVGEEVRAMTCGHWAFFLPRGTAPLSSWLRSLAAGSLLCITYPGCLWAIPLLPAPLPGKESVRSIHPKTLGMGESQRRQEWEQRGNRKFIRAGFMREAGHTWCPEGSRWGNCDVQKMLRNRMVEKALFQSVVLCARNIFCIYYIWERMW